MSDYPDRISISPVYRQERDDDFYLVDRKAFPGKGVEYVRADRIEELEAKLPPRTVSSWVNVYPCDDVEADGVDLSPPYPDRIEADACAGSNRSHVIRLDLTDGKLSVEVEQ
jgi:hypothetical protein